mmetsp:Transcript_6185/g.15890  ORF Transcript_6185/g.15890 Transcript_6185/m.15890 type:complete len:717 (+) Transcript_6185:167-2317(+)
MVKGGGGGGGGKEEEEAVVQAVLLADSFNVRFAPLTFTRPRALLPLANVALIDYTLELLVTSGVTEIYIFCRSFAAEIKAHVEASPWMRDKNVRIETRMSETFTVGDCLREVDTMDVIKRDFVLVTGDIVSNMDLEGLISAHTERVKANKNIVMSMLMKETEPGHYVQSREDDIMVATDEDGLLVAYSRAEDSEYLLSRSVFENAKAVDVRRDLLDCRLYICSPQLLMLFTDEFDCQDMDDFLTFIHSQEIADNCVFAEVIRDGYAARVGNLHAYDAVSMDVLRRWVYPLVPDSRLLQQAHSIQYKRHNVYLSDQVMLTRGCELQENVLVGFATVVGREGAPKTTLTNCIIGKRCKIGAGVRISNSYIWDDVVIGDGCQIDRCILASNVELKPEVVVEPGSVLGGGVVIDAGVTVRVNSKIALETCSTEDGGDFDDEDDGGADVQIDDTDEAWDLAVVGDKGKGKLWQPDDEDDEELFVWGSEWGEAADSTFPPFGDDEEDTEYEDESGSEDDAEAGAADDDFDGGAAAVGRTAAQGDDAFDLEIRDLICERVIEKFNAGMQDSVPVHELALESQGSRSAHNKTLNDVVHAMVAAVMYFSNSTETPTPARVQRIKAIFITIAPVLKKYLTTMPCQALFVESLESAAIQYPHAGDAFQTVLHAMYEEDLVEEEIVLRWHRNTKMAALSEAQLAIRKRVQPFIEWLENAEEESDEDSD